MSCNCDNFYEDAQENSCGGCDGGFDSGFDAGRGEGDCGCAKKEYLGKSVSETKYFRVTTTKNVPAPRKPCCCCRG